MSHRTPPLRHGITTVILLLVAIVPLWAGVLREHTVPAAATASELDGYTTCRPLIGTTRVWINPNLSGVDRERVEAHEAAHVRQIERDGCFRTIIAQSAPATILQREAEAHCAEVPIAVREGATFESAVQWAADAIWEGYPAVHHLRRRGDGEADLVTSREIVEATVRRTCQEVAR